MADYLNRSQSPLTEEQWEIMENAVVETAKKYLVGRRFLSLYGPLGAGVQYIDFKTYSGDFKAVIDFVGEGDKETLHSPARYIKQIPMIYKDFKIEWRDLETCTAQGLPIDTTPAAMSAVFVAQMEDELIFNGNPQYDIKGLLTAEGRSFVKMGNWDEEAVAYEDILKAAETLSTKGFHEPYALVVSPKLYSKLVRAYKNTTYLEIDLIKKGITECIYKSPAIKGEKAVLLSCGSEYVDLAVSQDITLAFLETSKMNHYFRVFEIVIPRIKVPAAICTIE
ncbi:bacteriocin family protein [Thermovorax subterraneus]|nr:bacteriocin family protein [Thermovorax subterraneus]